MNIFDHYRQRYEAAKDEEFTLQEFLTTCRQDRSAYANAAERLLMAIGEPVMVDTAQEPRLSRLFSNRVIARYPAFEEFYGMEDAIEQIVSYLKHAAQGLEEKKQILYLLGPVGGGKSSLAERLKSLMQLVPIYVLSANGERSPVNDHPFCLFNPQEDAQILEKEYGIPRRYLGTIMSPWAAKRLHEFGGDIAKVSVSGLGDRFIDKVNDAKENVLTDGIQTFPDRTDRVYLNPQDCSVINDEALNRIIAVGHQHHLNVVGWNPGPALSISMGDMPDDGYKTFVCVETAYASETQKVTKEKPAHLAQSIRVAKR